MIKALRMPSEGTGLHRPSNMDVCVFKMASSPEAREESELSVRARRNVTAMSPIPPWRLQSKSISWVPEQRAISHLASIVFCIGPQDMLFFEILGTSQRGLAAMADPRFSSEDKVRLFAETSYAFVLRSDASDSLTAPREAHNH